MAVLFHQGDQVFLELFERKGVPIGNGGVCFNEFEEPMAPRLTRGGQSAFRNTV